MSIADIPLAWVKGEDRKALCEQLFTQGFMSDFAGLKEASSPHFRALRKVLLPQLESGAAASSAEVGAPTPASIVRDYILLFNSPFFKLTLSRRNRCSSSWKPAAPGGPRQLTSR